MTFALFYNMQDLSAVAAALERANITYASNDDRGIIRACWSGGLDQWATAPLAPEPWISEDADCRIIVVTATYRGSAVTLAQMFDAWGRTVTANPREPDAYAGGIEILNAIVSDAPSGAREPWP